MRREAGLFEIDVEDQADTDEVGNPVGVPAPCRPLWEKQMDSKSIGCGNGSSGERFNFIPRARCKDGCEDEYIIVPCQGSAENRGA